MKTNRGFNPATVKARTEKDLIVVERVTQLGSSIATSIAVGIAGFIVTDGFIGELPIFGINIGFILSLLAAVASALIAGWATDFAFSNFLKESIFNAALFLNFSWLDKPAEQKWVNYYVYFPLLWVLKTTLVGVLLWFDIYCIKTSDRPVQTFAKQTQELDLAGEQGKVVSNLAKSDFSERISSLQKTISEKQNAFRNSPDGKNLQNLIAKNNGWAKNKMENGIGRTAAAEKAQLSDLQKKQDAITIKNQSLLEKSSKQLLDKNNRIVADNAAKRDSVSAIFNWFGIGMKLISIIIAFVLVLSFLINNPNYDANGDGKVDHKDVDASFQ